MNGSDLREAVSEHVVDSPFGHAAAADVGDREAEGTMASPAATASNRSPRMITRSGTGPSINGGLDCGRPVAAP